MESLLGQLADTRGRYLSPVDLFTSPLSAMQYDPYHDPYRTTSSGGSAILWLAGWGAIVDLDGPAGSDPR